MGDKYVLKPDGISTTVSKLKDDLNFYKECISKLNTLISEIEGSSEWIDMQVKTAFIQKCRSYIAVYKKLSLMMENFINYLDMKSNSGAMIDSAFIRG